MVYISLSTQYIVIVQNMLTLVLCIIFLLDWCTKLIRKNKNSTVSSYPTSTPTPICRGFVAIFHIKCAQIKHLNYNSTFSFGHIFQFSFLFFFFHCITFSYYHYLLAPSFTICVAFGKLLNLSELSLLVSQKRQINST